MKKIIIIMVICIISACSYQEEIDIFNSPVETIEEENHIPILKWVCDFVNECRLEIK